MAIQNRNLFENMEMEKVIWISPFSNASVFDVIKEQVKMHLKKLTSIRNTKSRHIPVPFRKKWRKCSLYKDDRK